MTAGFSTGTAPTAASGAHRRIPTAGIDQLGGTAVLVGEPVVGEMQIDPGRLDRTVTGLGLDRFERHPRFAQSGQTGVAQLMTRRLSQTGPVLRRTRRSAPARRSTTAHQRRAPFNDTNNESLGASAGRSADR